MDLYLLITHLVSSHLEIHAESDFSVELFGCKQITSKQEVFLPHIIYFGYSSQIPEKLPDDTLVNIICFDDTGLLSSFTGYSNINIILIKDNAIVEQIFERLQQLFLEDQQIISDMKLLLDALFSDMGIQYIADVASSLLGNPLCIADASYKYIAQSNMHQVKDPSWEEETNLGYILDRNVQVIKKSRLDEKVRNTNYPYYLETQDKKGILITLVKIHHIEVAHIAVFENNKKFTQNDYKLLYNMGKIVSQELQKNNLYTENRGLVFANLLADMLDNKVTNIKNIHQRFQTLGYSLKENLYVLTVNPSGYKSPKNQLNIIAEHLQRILPGSIYVIYRDAIVLLISRSKDSYLSPLEYQELREYLLQTNQVAGISRCFTDIWEIRRFYKQSVKAAELGTKVNGGNGVYCYDAYACYHMIELCSEQENLWNFCSPFVLKLMTYDRENRTFFLETLYHYLKNMKNPTKTSEELHIHRNTLFYRIDKIKTILGITLEDGYVAAEILFSVKMLFYIGENTGIPL